MTKYICISDSENVVMVEWHYNNGLQEVVTSIHFLKIVLQNYLDLSFSDHQSYTIPTELIKFVTKNDDEQFKSNLKHFYLL